MVHFPLRAKKPKSGSVFGATCHVCFKEVGIVKTNAQAKRVVDDHIQSSHFGLKI